MSETNCCEDLQELLTVAKAVVATSYADRDEPEERQVRVPPNREIVNALEEKIEELES